MSVVSMSGENATCIQKNKYLPKDPLRQISFPPGTGCKQAYCIMNHPRALGGNQTLLRDSINQRTSS